MADANDKASSETAIDQNENVAHVDDATVDETNGGTSGAWAKSVGRKVTAFLKPAKSGGAAEGEVGEKGEPLPLTTLGPDERLELVMRVRRGLFVFILLNMALIFGLISNIGEDSSAGYSLALVFFVGVIGGFVGIQQRVKGLPDQDLKLIAESWVDTGLAPFVGGVLAVLLYGLFLSKLLAGELFPELTITASPGGGLHAIRNVTGAPTEYAKLLVWSFLAGYSERFVFDVLGRFTTKATENA